MAEFVSDSTKLLPCPNPWCDSAVRPMPFTKRDGSVEVICGCNFHGPSMASRDEAIAAWNTRAAPPAMDREAVAKAIADADAAFGYSCNLTRLVDGVATYTLTMTGYEPAEFDSIDDAHLVIAERRNAARADALSTLSADAIRQGEGAKDWVPQIGERVAISPACPYLSDWHATALWCCGVRVHDSGDGLDITVTEQWPMPSRHSRGYLGPTDGFRLNASHYADDIIRLATPASHASDGGEA